MASLTESLGLTDGGVVSIVGAGGKTSLMYRIAGELCQAQESVLTTTTTKILMPAKDQSPKVIVSDSLAAFLDKSAEALKDVLHLTAASAVLTARPEGERPRGTMDLRRKLIGFQPEFIDAVHDAGVFKWILVEADGAAGKPLKAPDPHEPVIPGSTAKLIAVMGLDGVGKPLEDEWVFRPHRFSEITGVHAGAIVTAADCVISLIHKNGIMKGTPASAERLVFLNKADHPDRLRIAREIVALLENEKDSGVGSVIIGQALHQPPVIETRILQH